MDITLLSFLVATVLGIVQIGFNIYALEEGRRAALLQWARSWIWRIFVVVTVCNSILGIYLFGVSVEPVTRGSVLMLVVHIFNLLGVGTILFFEATGKALEQRMAKRKELEATVDQLKARLDSLGA